MKAKPSFEQVSNESRVKRDRAKQAVKELSVNLQSRLANLPGLTDDTLMMIIRDILTSAQPDVLSQLSELEIREVIEGRLV